MKILKISILVLGILLLVSLVAIVIYAIRSQQLNKKYKMKSYSQLVGSYELEISKTNLGKYKEDSMVLRNLVLNLNADSTFVLNFDVPFFYDSIGRWEVSGNKLDELNKLYFKNWNYKGLQTSEQFTQLYKNPENTDSLIMINSLTPKKGEENIKTIFFKKIR